jgi:hypothetical protein
VEVSPESVQLLEDMQEVSLDLRGVLETFVEELRAKNPQLKEGSKEHVIFSGLSHLMTKIDDVADELKGNETKVLEAMSNGAVSTNASNFQQTVLEFAEFFKGFSSWVYFKFKGAVKKKLQLINLIFSSRWNHFMTSVCLNVNLKLPPMSGGTSPYYEEGNKYLFGIDVPRNYNLAYANFLEGAESGDVPSMESVAQCYRQGWGVDCDIDAAQKWLQRAITQGSSAAKCSLALLLLAEVQDSDIDDDDRDVIVQHAISLLFNAANEVL